MSKNNYELESYKKEYSDQKLTTKILKYGKKMGAKLIYMCLILYYTLKSPEVPMKMKTVIIGALGYVIAPIDLIFDATPVAGYTDDLASVMAAFAMISMYVTPAIKQQARDKMKDIFGDMIEEELVIIEMELNDKNC